MHNTPKQRYFELRIYLNLLDQLYIPNNIVTFRSTNYAELVPPLIHGLDGGCWFPTGLGPDGDLRVFFPLAEVAKLNPAAAAAADADASLGLEPAWTLVAAE